MADILAETRVRGDEDLKLLAGPCALGLAMPPGVSYCHRMDFRSQLEFLLLRLALMVMRTLPFAWSAAVLRRTARLAGRCPGGRRRVVVDQLRRVYPSLSQRELAGLADRVYDHLGLTIAEAFLAEPAALARQVAVSPGWGGLDQALSAGSGAIVVTGHLGNFELGGRVLAQRFPLLDVVKTQRNAPFDRFLQEQRLRFGIRTVPVENSGRAVLAHLRAGGLVTLLVDQDAGKTGFRTEFLGLPASTWPGAARIAIRTGCPVVPVAILRNDDGTHTLHIGETLTPRDLTDREEDIREFTGLISRAVERSIQDRPEQWFWVHRRWKGALEARGADESTAGI
jgi:KDO2-lipid IV(A) lauroyltransferase